MTSFTDDDLKRLKEEIRDPLYQRSEHRQLLLGNFGGLLARLEAAERTCKAAECVRDMLHWGDERQMVLRDVLVIELEAWRKACGRE